MQSQIRFNHIKSSNNIIEVRKSSIPRRIRRSDRVLRGALYKVLATPQASLASQWLKLCKLLVHPLFLPWVIPHQMVVHKSHSLITILGIH